ncbi:MAG TPA: PDZ domain-containing protein [Candidatus Saccharimonadales bacterium]|nr:PDZ domain-containing protein [Candidatus Saccharimonadales bacterium]
MSPHSAGLGSDEVADWLVDLIRIETRIADSLGHWGGSVRDHPEAADTIERARDAATSHRVALEARLEATGGRHASVASEPLLVLVPPSSASAALRRAADVALEAAFAYEAAYQTARLAYDGDTCDLLEAHLGEYSAMVADARRALPHTVARELRGVGVTCACRCPMCSIGACGCVRNTLATVELAWAGQEPARAAALTLLVPPREGSQLAEAGLEEGDRILAVDGDAVGSNQEMQVALRRHEVGQEARLEVERLNGQRYEVIVRRVG